MKILLIVAVGLLLIGGAYFINRAEEPAPQLTVPAVIPDSIPVEKVVDGHKNTTYLIEGKPVTLEDGVSEEVMTPGLAPMVLTEYFGNELITDLDADGDEDVVFLLTQNGGGSGTFYYAVAAINTDDGYVGSDGYLLGDRIAPQSTELSGNGRHKNVVVINYADRAPGDTMVVPPSVNKSVYLKIDPVTNRWGIVEPNFEGESR